MKLIGILLNGGDESVIKNLQPDWYPFGPYEEPHLPENEFPWKNKSYPHHDYLSTLYKQVAEKDDLGDLQVSVSCIVGQNGSGKSTLLEILFRIINNLAWTIFDSQNKMPTSTGRQLSNAWGFDACLFVETDGMLMSIHASDSGVMCAFDFGCESEQLTPEKIRSGQLSIQVRTFLSHFFYTIISNYSIYSLNFENILQRRLKNTTAWISGDWLRGIIEKNDGYTMPMTIVPYRKNGVIDSSKVERLATHRLATLAMLFASQKKPFMDGKYVPHRLCYSLKSHVKSIYNVQLQGLLRMHNKEVSDAFKSQIRYHWEMFLKESPRWQKISREIRDALLSYLTYKTFKLGCNYSIYREIIFPHETDTENIDISCLIKRLAYEDPNTHILWKIRQCVQFMNTNLYYNSNGTITPEALQKEVMPIVKQQRSIDSAYRDSDRFLSYEEVFMVMPPSIFDWNMEYRHKGEDQTKAKALFISQMSSGEKQLYYGASSIIYHINHIQSIRDTKMTIAYHHINIVMDEAELYYHPEYQRNLICYLVQMLAWSHIDKRKIRSVNFLIATHSPFVLSDVPCENVLFIKDGTRQHVKSETFAANYHDLLYNNFFLSFSVGEVARININKLIEIYRRRDELTAREQMELQSNRQFYQYLVDTIAEPYTQKMLREMFDTLCAEKSNERDRLRELYKQRDLLNEQINALEGESHEKN